MILIKIILKISLLIKKNTDPFEFLSIEVYRTYIVLAWPSHVPPDIVNGYTLVINGTVIQLDSDVTDYNITGLKMDTYYKIDLTRDNGDRDDQSITTTEITSKVFCFSLNVLNIYI